MALSAQEAITRFKESEERTHVLVNDPDDVGFYTTDTTPAKQVETYPHFIKRITNTADGAVAQAQAAADRSEAAANQANQILIKVGVEGDTQIQRIQDEGQKYIDAAGAEADRAEDEANRAQNYADAAGLGTFAYNIRRVAVLQEDVISGSVMKVPAAFYPGRSILYLSINGIVCSPKGEADVVDPSLHQYEEVGDDPQALSDEVRVYFDVDAGSTIDCWVVASNQEASAITTDASEQTLTTGTATDTEYTVSDYLAGHKTLSVFVNGVLAKAGASIDDGFYKEIGIPGEVSNTIQVFEALPEGTELSTTSLVRRL